ncbi:MAG: hypothetical protein FJX35_10635 [Alphaproteobacteria bacterium]|nr:hypothetical protein [Alphaproteobacteria bacterium]
MTIQDRAAASYGLGELLAEMRRAAAATSDPRAIIKRLTAPLRRAAMDKSWLKPEHYRPAGERGIGVTLLHEEPDHALAVYVVAWPPGSSVLPHDHQTWALVAGVDGTETNVFWQRDDDGSVPGRCTVVESHRRSFGSGDVVAFLPDDIHSVQNDTDKVALSIHIYGRNLNMTGRSEFDPALGIVRPLTMSSD